MVDFLVGINTVIAVNISFYIWMMKKCNKDEKEIENFLGKALMILISLWTFSVFVMVYFMAGGTFK